MSLKVQITNGVQSLKEGDTATEIKMLLIEGNGTIYDYTGKDAKFVVSNRVGKLFERPVVSTDKIGEVVFSFEEGEVTGSGQMFLEIHIDTGAETKIFPSSDYLVVSIDKSLNIIGQTITSYQYEQLRTDVAIDIGLDIDQLNENIDSIISDVTGELKTEIVDSAKIIWKSPVANFAALTTTYPSAVEGDTAMARDTGKVYRFDGSIWIEIQEIDPTAINEVDTRLTSRVTDIFVNVKTFGATGNGTTNDTAAILSALNFLKPTGGVLYFPKGTYLTAPIDLTGFNNLVIRGYNNTTFFPYTTQTRIKINSVGNVGIKCAETGVEIPTVVGKGICIENIYLDCDYKVDIGINMRIAVTVSNTCVRYSNGDGVVLEGQSYPVELRRVVSQYNRGHGLRVKAPFTTVYNIYDCEFGFNDLQGAYIEDGSTCLWQNVLIQSNKQGGLRMVQQSGTGFSQPIFLERMTFINLYTEANGTLDAGHPSYIGNYAIRIEGLNQDGTLATGKIPYMTFINGSINKPSTGNYVYVRGTDSIEVINTPNFMEYVDLTYNRRVKTNVGTLRVEGPLDLSRTNGGQIQFPATQNPSTNANTLDDYEEGTFNLELGQLNANSFTVSGTTTARYIKIGRVVTCFFDYSWSSKNSASDVFACVMKNLPYAVISGTYQAGTPVDMLVTGGTTDRYSIYPSAALSVCNFRKNGHTSNSIISDFPASGRISGVFSYYANL